LTHGVIYDFIRKLKRNPRELEVLGNGKQIKPYLYVKDVVDGIQFIINHANEPYNLFNLGTKTRTAVSQIADLVIAEMGLDAKIKYAGGDRGWIGDVPEFRYDTSKLASLGWVPSHNSLESIQLAIRESLE
jgi:UDP-glucose 4-epimerase